MCGCRDGGGALGLVGCKAEHVFFCTHFGLGTPTSACMDSDDGVVGKGGGLFKY